MRPVSGNRRVILVTTLVLVTLPAVPTLAEDLTLRMPPVKISVPIDNQLVTITTTATLSGRLDRFQLELTADLADLQDHATNLLQAQLNRSERCGERLSIERATLVPAPPASILTAYVHYEHWACFKVLGKEIAKRMVGGEGAIAVKLTPAVDADNQMKLVPEVGKSEAESSLGEVLRSPSIGDKVRDKISSSILSAMQKGTNLGTTLPPGVERVVSIRSMQFASLDSTRLLLEIEGDVLISASEQRELPHVLKI